MSKVIFTAATLSLTALSVQAAPANTPAEIAAIQTQELSYSCEWVTVHDFWGNWIVDWQCN